MEENLKFTAFPVTEGDAFMLEFNKKCILIDTGRVNNECLKLIKANNTNIIDLIIITHYDKDHVGGLKEILNSDIKVTEIWLPAGFKSFACYESNYENSGDKRNDDNDQEIQKFIQNKLDEREEELIVDIELPKEIVLGSTKKGISQLIDEKIPSDFKNLCGGCDILFFDCHYEFNKLHDLTYNSKNEYTVEGSLERIAQIRECLNRIEYYLLNYGFSRNYNNFYPTNIKHIDEGKLQLSFINMKHTDKIKDIYQIAVNKGIKIKSLKYSDNPIDEDLKNEYSIKLLNCIETDKTEKFESTSEKLFALTRINKESLVFLFNYDGLPNILFTADSDFAFIHKKLKIKNNSIVTAPHHGSRDFANVKVYLKVDGNNLIYVRSDKLKSPRPCDEYINQKIKYCTICNNDKQHQKVELVYNNENWTAIDDIKQCTCEIKKQEVLNENDKLI